MVAAPARLLLPFTCMLLHLLDGHAAADPAALPQQSADIHVPACSVVFVGAVRVTALSPRLLRIEPRGPLGFWNSTTFLVVNRSGFGTGIPLRTESTNATHATLATDFYSVFLAVGTSENGSVLIGASVAVNNGGGTAEGSTKVVWSSPDLTSVSARLHWPDPLQAPAYAIKDYPRFFVPPWGPTPIPQSHTSNVDPALVATNGYDFRQNVDGDVYVFLGLETMEGWAAGRADFIALGGPTPVLPDWAFGVWYTWWYPYNESFAKAEILNWSSHKLPLDVWGLDMNWRNTPHGHADSVSAAEAVDDEKRYDSPNVELFPDLAVPRTSWFDWIKAQGLRTYFNDHPCPALNGTAMQASPQEVAFRWQGLTEWMDRGLTYWWFDANWGVSIPPPNVNPVPCAREDPACDPATHGATATWNGLSNIVWGSHVYYETSRVYTNAHPSRTHTNSMDRPMALTKFAAGRHGHPTGGVHPASHRFPVHWTGDSVSLSTTVDDMLDAGVSSFMQYVHSDCGNHINVGQGNATESDEAGDNIRWTALCTFSGIFRYHGGHHVPWRWGVTVEDSIRRYLNLRVKLLPSLVAAGHAASLTGWPLTARCDLHAPQCGTQARKASTQFVFLNDTLVAPIDDQLHGTELAGNVTTRTVWLPPGQWENAWTGATVTANGCETSVNVSVPYEQIPLWHRAGGLTVLAASEPGLRTAEQDWSTLTLEAFPHALNARHDGTGGSADEVGSNTQHRVTRRAVVERGVGSSRTEIEMITFTQDQLQVKIGASTGNATAAAHAQIKRGWIVRLHLRPAQCVIRASFVEGGIDAKFTTTHVEVTHLAPLANDDPELGRYMPFQGAGARPPPAAGHVAELRLAPAAHARTLEVSLGYAASGSCGRSNNRFVPE